MSLSTIADPDSLAHNTEPAPEPSGDFPLHREGGCLSLQAAQVNDKFCWPSDNPLTWEKALNGSDREESDGFQPHLNGVENSPYDSDTFLPPWARRMWSKCFDADRGARAELGNDCYTTMLTFVGDPSLDGGGRIPLIDFLHYLEQSREARMKALRRVIDGKFHYLETFGIHEESAVGYPHTHVGVWMENQIGRADFESVLRAHVDNSPVAAMADHGAGAVSEVKRASETLRAPDPEYPAHAAMTAYLGGNVPGLVGLGVNEESYARKRGATVFAAAEKDFQLIRHSDL